MDNSLQNSAITKPWQTPADRRTLSTGIRLYRDQIAVLNEEYKGNGSVLLRLLLDEFINDNLPVEFKLKFIKVVSSLTTK